MRDWRSEKIGLRGFANPMAARNLYNDIPDDVVDTLLEVCRRNTGVFQRYFRLKARWLGMEKLRRYDIYAPLVKSDRRYSFNQAAHTVLESFDAFLPVTARLARRVFDEQHLDSEVRKGKRSGAFCATITPDLTPYVLVDYQGRADDVATLAHQLGHAIHSMLPWLAFDGFRAATLNWSSFSQVAFAFDVSPSLLVRGVAFACLIGLIGGLFPAVRAARQPVSAALREQ